MSGSKSQVKVGNFIGDFVKGSRYNEFPSVIRKGILLHRKIDEFTDLHPVVRNLNGFLRPTFGRYSAIILDMYFDYFLAINFKTYSSESLHVFSLRFYAIALVNYRHLPKRVKGFIFHFICTNRLKKYASLKGLRASLEIMANYKIPTLDPDKSISFLVEHHDHLEREFLVFFVDLLEFSETKLSDNN